MSKLSCMQDNNEFITIKETIEFLQLSKTQFYRIRTREDFPKLRHDYTNKHVDSLRRKTARAVYHREEINKWKEKHQQKIDT